MSHYTDRTHFFRTDDGERQTVITTQLSGGGFEAIMIEGLPEGVLEMEGRGLTRFAAIADLQARIEKELAQ